MAAPPPVPSSPTGDNPGSKGYIMFDLNLGLIVFSTLLISLRLYTRAAILKVVGLDDYVAVVAWAFCCALSSMEIYLVRYGVGRHMQDVDPAELVNFFNFLPSIQLVYLSTSGIVRLVISAFLPRLCRDKLYRSLVYSIAVINVMLSLTCIFVLLTECVPIADLWNASKANRSCLSKDKEALMFYGHQATAVFIDVGLMAVPIWMIRKYLRFSTRKTIQVVFIFGFGAVAVVTGIVRLVVMIRENFAVDTTWKMVTVTPWTDVEPHLGLWVACFPSIQPLLRRACQHREAAERALVRDVRNTTLMREVEWINSQLLSMKYEAASSRSEDSQSTERDDGYNNFSIRRIGTTVTSEGGGDDKRDGGLDGPIPDIERPRKARHAGGERQPWTVV